VARPAPEKQTGPLKAGICVKLKLVRYFLRNPFVSALYIFVFLSAGCGSKQNAKGQKNETGAVTAPPAQPELPSAVVAPQAVLPRATEQPTQSGPARPSDKYATAVVQREAAAALGNRNNKGLAPGGSVIVELREAIDTSSSYLPPFIPGVVVEDVVGPGGELVIPAGSQAVMMPRVAGRNGTLSGLLLALFSVEVNGKSLFLTSGTRDTATAQFVEESANGAGHRSVHLSSRSVVRFKIHAPVDNH
jgi:hypothetical protein